MKPTGAGGRGVPAFAEPVGVSQACRAHHDGLAGRGALEVRAGGLRCP